MSWARDPLILSVFPGIDLLGRAFEEEWPEACVVRGPDLLWGGDIRAFHPPAGKFEGVIGGPPCKGESQLARLNGLPGESMRSEFYRVLIEARPRWWLFEAVRKHGAPWVRCACCDNYWCHLHAAHAHDCLCPDLEAWDDAGLTPYTEPWITALSPRWIGEAQSRKRYFHSNLSLAALVQLDALEPVAYAHTVRAANRRGAKGTVIDGQASYSLADMKRLQGLPADFTLPAFTVRGQEEAIGNGVPLPMGRAIAKAVRQALAP